MGTAVPDSGWFDSSGNAILWKTIPLRALKRAIFKRGDTTISLLKMVIGSATYDFTKTAKGGAVICPPDYSVIEFVAPDGHLTQEARASSSFGDALAHTISILNAKPVPAWDNFAKWLNGSDYFRSVVDEIAKCELATIDGNYSQNISLPDFTSIDTMAKLLEATYAASTVVHSAPLSRYQLDNAAFGWRLKLTSVPNENGETTTIVLGFLFRE